MDTKKTILYTALGFILFMLWSAWQQDYHISKAKAQAKAQSDVPAQVASQTKAQDDSSDTAPSLLSKGEAAPTSRLINVKTDVFNVVIDRKGGNIVKASLLKYPVSYKQKNDPVVLLSSEMSNFFVAQSGLMGPKGPATPKGQAVYSAQHSNYVLAENEKTLTIALTWHGAGGVVVTKNIIFTRGKYNIDVHYIVNNQSGQVWRGQLYAQLKRKQPPSSGFLSFHTFAGAAISSAEKPYQKISYKDMDKKEVDTVAKGGWLAMQERYFLSAWIPNQKQANHYYSRVNDDVYTLGVVGPQIVIDSGNKAQTGAQIYVGPEIATALAPLAPHLDLTIDYGWLWILSVGIFWIMSHIYQIVGNWGVSIILVTVLIKLLFYKLSESSYRSMAKMRKVAPRLQELKERYGNDKQKISQETMALYKREKVNPLGGCLPILIQIPFFFALYYVLVESVQLRQAPFIFWIHDLSTKDPFYVLPILMGISMWVQQKLNPPPPDPMQAKMMMLMPIMFTVFFLAFPSGLVLYWLTNNVLSILQQWYITQKVAKEGTAKVGFKKKKKN